jgi:FG-GAP-like repeat
MLWSGAAADRSHATRTACHDLFRVSAIVQMPFDALPVSTVVGQFNSDRRADVAVAGSHGIRVLLADASGGFDVAASRLVRVRAASLSAGEFNNDGRTDLVASSLDGRVFVLIGDGLGNFAPGPAMGAQNPYVQAVADLNSDAKSDVVLTTSDSDGAHLRLLLGDGAGALSESGAFPVAADGFPVAVEPLDADPRPDVLLAGPAGATVLQILSGDGSGGLRPAVDADNRVLGVGAMALADFNEDRHVDVAVMGRGAVAVLFGDGRGHFAEPNQRIFLSGGGYSGGQVRTADFNGDGRADLAVSGNDNGDVFVYLGTGTGRFRPAEGTPEYGGIYPSAPLALGDTDGDRRPDLIGLRGGGAAALRVLRNTGGRTPRHVRAQTIQMIAPRPPEVVRGEGLTLSARLRCHPGQVALFRRPLRHPRAPWRRIETATTDYRGVAEVSDQPRVSSEYQWRPTGRGKGRIKPTQRVTVRVVRRASTAD